MHRLARVLLVFAIFFGAGLAALPQSFTPTALAQNNVINVCSHNATQEYNILGSNAGSLRAKLDNTANFGPGGAYGDYTFRYIDVGDNFKKQTLLDNTCKIWFSGYEPDTSYTPDELNELKSWVQDANGQVMAGCDDTAHDPVCALLDFSVATDTDTYGYLTDTGAANPLNCNGALTPNSRLEMDGGAGGYFSGPGVTAENVLAVHETNDVADNTKPIVVYTGNFFFTADINMIQAPTLSDGPNVTNNNDFLAMNAFSALADASVGKAICTSVAEVTPIPTVEEATPAPTPPTLVTSSWGDVHIRTPDGLVYDFQEFGEFLLTQSTSGDVVLQARQEAWVNNPRVSINTAAALWVAGDKLEFYMKPEPRFFINDALSDLPSSTLNLPQGGRIEVSQVAPKLDMTIYWPDENTGARVILQGSSHIDIGIGRLNGSLTYEGVFGNLDGDPQNDMQIRGGDLITPPASHDQLKTFGDSWRLSADESLFRDPVPATEAVAPEAPLTLFDIDPAARAAAGQTCQSAGIADQLALDTCTYDVAATGDETFVESAKTFDESIAALPPAERVNVTAVPSQALEVGQQYAIPDSAGTFQYFQLTQLPAQAGDPALLKLCPDLQDQSLVAVRDIMTGAAALAQGLTATNAPCFETSAPVAEPTAAPAVEPTAAPAVEPTAAPAVEPTAAPVAEPATDPVADLAADPAAALGGLLTNPIVLGVLGLLVVIVIFIVMRRR